jgi:hypothetical protein
MKTRPDRQLISDALSLAVDSGPCESDRTFFLQQPQRNFRLRPAWTVEVEEAARYDGITTELPDGWCWWMLVHQIVRHKVRFRWLIAAPHDLSIDPPEPVARAVWRACIPPAWKKQVRTLQHNFARKGGRA